MNKAERIHSPDQHVLISYYFAQLSSTMRYAQL